MHKNKNPICETLRENRRKKKRKQNRKYEKTRHIAFNWKRNRRREDAKLKYEVEIMESCFPPLAGLSLRDSSNATKGHKNRHSTSGTSLSSQDARNNAANSNECMPKLEVLQDLDLYYIRQIASSLKVTHTHTDTHIPVGQCHLQSAALRNYVYSAHILLMQNMTALN